MSEIPEIPEATEARALMTASEAHRVSGAVGGLDLAVQAAQQAITMLEHDPQAASPEVRRLLAAAWKWYAFAEEGRGTQTGSRTAVAAFDKARHIFLTAHDPLSAEDQHELGSLWTHRGMNLLNLATRETLLGALDAFDQAVTIRRALPLDTNWLFRYGLAASLMNRADALTRLGSAAELTEAVRSYDDALACLSHMPPEAHPGAVRQRQAVAWMNRGITLQAQQTELSLRDALHSFDSAIALLQGPPVNDHPEHRRILACALVNRASALLDSVPIQALPARQSAVEALTLLSGLEENDLVAAEAGLKARYAQCRALAFLLESGASETMPETGDAITEMTDAVDDALALARRWEGQGVTHLEPVAATMFRVGSRLFAVRQPHFLAEFLLDHLDPERTASASTGNPEMHAVAEEAFWHGAETIRRRCEAPASTTDPSRLERDLQTLADLQEAGFRLTQLRQQCLTTPSTAPA